MPEHWRLTEKMKQAALEILQEGLEPEVMVQKLFATLCEVRNREAVANYRRQYLGDTSG